ncbi:hypothetical protein DMH25_42755 [Streptomyces sp. WAC 01325]|uniref:DUF485 domain-containing protein n=1 Tax=Streptomyces sp. WAC 01325 TaxID=2203202 RepID=UPI000F860C72|nr:hypothetical protein DMH25_42755 [Streptomyces sp. WAC 01325]
MQQYDHSWLASQPSRSTLKTLRTARKRSSRVAATVIGAQLSTVVLAAEVPGIMSHPIVDPFNVGLFLILMQIGFTACVIIWYGRYAKKRLDPASLRFAAELKQRGDTTHSGGARP